MEPVRSHYCSKWPAVLNDKRNFDDDCLTTFGVGMFE
jgi:hypothetical protein